MRILNHLADLLQSLARRRDGAVSPLIALLIVPILGALALGSEVSAWFVVNRSAQNAADSAAMAAATSGCATMSSTCQSTYTQAAEAVARNYDFVNGVDNTTVATSIVACPAGGTVACYQVEITRIVPVRLAGVVGFNGDVALGGGRGQTVRATAISRARINAGYCIMGMANTGNTLQINGGPSFDLGGCDVYSNNNMRCNGNGSWGIASSYAVGNADCAASNFSSQPPIADPFAYLSTTENIPAPPPSGCVARNFTTTQSVSVDTIANTCGNFTIANNVTLTVTGTGVLRIYQSAANNGNLVLSNGNSRLLASDGLTVIFTGTPARLGPSFSPGFITGSGVVDFAAPRSGTWSGIAVYQDNRMSASSNRTYSGNSPTFNLTGLTYAKHANMTFSGAINHHTGGDRCMGLLSNSLLINGTGSIFANPTAECAQAGLTLPTGMTELFRQALVQ